MTEKTSINLNGSDRCGFEGIQGRPVDCKNNPWRYPDNYRPGLCLGCPENPKIPTVAEGALPIAYIKIKQQA